ncbi:MAG: amidohydrolase family protein, partial [Oceanococcaceae bacterium]
RTIIVTHCEDTPTVMANEAAAREKYGEAIPIHEHPHIRSREACLKSSTLAVELARKHGTRLHVLHLTTADELRHFSAGPLDDKQITVEACVHHLYFSAEDYADKGALIKCNPAIKTAADREALRQAVAEDRIDVIATDHAPHTWEEKHAGNYFNEPAGLPLVQHAVPMALELVHDGVLGLEKAVEKLSHGPARMFGVQERGYLREGWFADLILVDMDNPQMVRKEDVLYKCGWSPLEGRRLRSRILKTFVNGDLAYDEGVFAAQPVGQRLRFRPA